MGMKRDGWLIGFSAGLGLSFLVLTVFCVWAWYIGALTFAFRWR